MHITMRYSLKSLFATGLLAISVSHVQAEWQPVPGHMPANPAMLDNMPQVPWASPDMMPITWGDCIPVPVAPDMPMGIPQPSMQAPMPYLDSAAPTMDMPMNMAVPFPAAPPSPFYGDIPVVPLPLEANSQCAPAIDDGSKEKLTALQARYDNASEASRNKIEELKQILNDTQNQLQDSVASLGALNKSKESDSANLSALKKKMEALTKASEDMLSLKEKENAELKKHLAKLDNAGSGIQQQLVTISKGKETLQKEIEALTKASKETLSLKEKENAALKKQLFLATEKSGQQAQKLMAFGQSANDMNVLKQQLASMTKTNSDMQLKLKTMLKQSSTKLTAIQSAHGIQAKENEALKKQLAELNAASKNMHLQIGTLKTDSADKSKQLLAFKKTSSQLASLQEANQLKTAENDALKKQLEELDNSYKKQRATVGNTEAALKSQIARLKQVQQDYQGKNDTLTKKLTSVGNSEATLKSELSKLQQIYNTQLGKNDTLIKQLADLNVAYKSLQAQTNALKTEAAGQNKTISGLKESSNKLGLLQQAYSAQQANAANLKSQLASCANAKNDLESCKASIDQNSQKLVASLDNATRLKEELDQLKTKSAAQAKEIEGLMATTAELNKLKTDLVKATEDTDKDGILDKADKCPYTIAGTKVNAMGCAEDSDKDGIVDADDKCPDSPFGSHVNEEGCPKVVEVAKVEVASDTATKDGDADKDGVADGKDLCPTSEAGASVNEFGCKATENITLEGVTFKLGSAQLKQSSLAVLDTAAKSLVSNPELKIQIEGHTDNQGWTGANKRLSQRRANTVMIYLIRKGVKAEALIAKGFGESQPITTNDTAEGRAKNRRVDLKIIK